LHAEGHLIASHTNTHRILRFLPDEEKRKELADSRQRIEDKLQTPVRSVVYPYGGPDEVDERTVAVAAECGYTHAYLNVKESFLPPDSLTISRFSLPFSQQDAFLYAITSGLHDQVRKVLAN